MLQADDIPVEARSRVLFTAPWEPLIVRRGDALGLSAVADQFADAVAPHLSNRIRDGRWVTILAWCLARSQEVFHASGGRSVATRTEQRERYAWLRPLELMWIARTILLADDWRQRSLAGQRRVRPWCQDDGQPTNRFGMSSDQFRAYRQTGMYGAYRLAFRKWPGMTVGGDGWTPGLATNSLAEWLEGKLGVARPSWALHAGEGDDGSLSSRSAKRARGEEHRWWPKEWPTFDHAGRKAEEDTLPRLKRDFSVLPEGTLLKPLLFGSDPMGGRRTAVAREVAKARATDHIEVCEHLAVAFSSDPTIRALPLFSRLADAGMALMDIAADTLRGKTAIRLSEVAGRAKAKATCKELFAAAQAWKQVAAMQLRHVETAHRFAGAIPGDSAIACLQAVIQHHEVYGGGLRWFALRNGKIEPRTPPLNGSSRYRFRLWSLCRIGVQCEVLRAMPAALLARREAGEDESESENSDE